MSLFLSSIILSLCGTLLVQRESAAAQHDDRVLRVLEGVGCLLVGSPPMGGTGRPSTGQTRTVCQSETAVV